MPDVFLQMGKRGTVVIPAKVRKRLGFEDGSLLILTEKNEAIELRLAKLEAPTADSRKQLAGSILSQAENLGEYLAAIEEVRGMGLDTEDVPHERFS